MRQLTAEIAKREFTLTASFAASMEIAEQIADPMQIARDISASTLLEQTTGSFAFTIDNVSRLLYIGAKAGGSDIKLKEMQELVFEHGFFDSQAVATDYLTLIIGPQPEESVEQGSESSSAGKT